MKADWRRFSTSNKKSALQFYILDGRFIRIRDRSMDDSEKGLAYPVIDIKARRVVNVEYRPREQE
jgi:hypothetical protein